MESLVKSMMDFISSQNMKLSEQKMRRISLMSTKDIECLISLPEEIKKYMIQTVINEDFDDPCSSFRRTSLLNTVKKVAQESENDVELIQEVIELYKCPLLVVAQENELDIYGREISKIAILLNGKSYLRDFKDMFGDDTTFSLLGPTFIHEYATIVAEESRDLPLLSKEYIK